MPYYDIQSMLLYIHYSIRRLLSLDSMPIKLKLIRTDLIPLNIMPL